MDSKRCCCFTLIIEVPLILALLLSLLVLLEETLQSAPAAGVACWAPGVKILVLWSPQCGHCEPVEERALEKLSREVGFKVEPRYVDIDKIENYAKLVEIEKLMGVKSQDLPVVLVDCQLIEGAANIRKDIRAASKVENLLQSAERFLKYSTIPGARRSSWMNEGSAAAVSIITAPVPKLSPLLPDGSLASA